MLKKIAENISAERQENVRPSVFSVDAEGASHRQRRRARDRYDPDQHGAFLQAAAASAHELPLLLHDPRRLLRRQVPGRLVARHGHHQHRRSADLLRGAIRRRADHRGPALGRGEQGAGDPPAPYQRPGGRHQQDREVAAGRHHRGLGQYRRQLRRLPRTHGGHG